ncbi:MAG: hypothetical protein KY467_08505 [Gemmatimonadetes bacterium]|nr:hypothetical protein [Gemmatimonadota bacterium]
MKWPWIVVTIGLGITLVILAVLLSEHRLGPPEDTWKGKFLEIRRYDATGTRLLPWFFLTWLLFHGFFIWLVASAR